MDVYEFETRMMANGKTIANTTMLHNNGDGVYDVYKVLEVYLEDRRALIKYEDSTHKLSMESWKVTDVRCSIARGFYWVIV